MTVGTRPKRKLVSKPRFERRTRALDDIIKAYNESAESRILDARSTEDLVEMHNKSSVWLHPPCGDINIDGGILARYLLIGKILRFRGARFTDGKFHL